MSLSYDETNGYVALASYSRAANNIGQLYVGTINGTSLTFASEAAYETLGGIHNTLRYNSFNNTFVVTWMSYRQEDLKTLEFTLDTSGSATLGTTHTLTTTEVGQDNNYVKFGVMPCSLGTVYTFFEKANGDPSYSVMKSLVNTADSYVI